MQLVSLSLSHFGNVTALYVPSTPYPGVQCRFSCSTLPVVGVSRDLAAGSLELKARERKKKTGTQSNSTSSASVEPKEQSRGPTPLGPAASPRKLRCEAPVGSLREAD